MRRFVRSLKTGLMISTSIMFFVACIASAIGAAVGAIGVLQGEITLDIPAAFVIICIVAGSVSYALFDEA